MALLFVAGSVSAKDVASLKAVLQDASTTETYTLTNPVTVVYQNGKYLYVKDATASALVYGTVNLTGLVNGQTVTGLQCTYTVYNSLPELVPVSGITLTASDAASAVAVSPVATTIKGITTASVCQYVKLSNVTLKSDYTFASKTKSTLVYQGDNSTTVFNQFGTLSGAFTAGQYDVTGFVTNYKGTLEIQPLTMTAVPTITAPAGPSVTGATFVSGSKYYLLNTGDYYFLNKGNDWGTRASLAEDGILCTVNAVTGGYNIVTNVNNTGNKLFMAGTDAAYMDNVTNAVWVITPVSGTDQYTIQSASTNAYTTADTYLGWNGTGTIVYPNLQSTQYINWKFVAEADYTTAKAAIQLATAKTTLYNKIVEAEAVYVDVTDAVALLSSATATAADMNNEVTTLNAAIWAAKVQGATKENPVSLTGAVINADCESGTTGWTHTGFGNNFGQIAITNTYFTNHGIEVWAPSGTSNTGGVSQTINNLPNGVYSLTLSAYGTDQSGATTESGSFVAFGNTQSTPIVPFLSFTNDNDAKASAASYTVNDIVVTNGTLTLGLKCTNSNVNWYAFDNVVLNYVGEVNVDDLITLVNKQLAEATPLLTEAGQKTVMDALNADVTKANAAIAAKDASALLTVSQALTADIPAAKTTVASYKTLVDAITAATTLNNATSYPGKADFTAAIATANQVVTDATADAATVDAAVTTLNAAVDAYKFSLTKGASALNPVDVSFLIVNPNMDLKTGWNNAGAYDLSEMEVFNANTIDVYQILRNMPAGTYKLSCQAFYRAGGYAAAATSRDGGTESLNVSLYANSVSTPVKSIFDEAQDARIFTTSDWQSDAEVSLAGATKYIPNSMAGSRKWFDANKYNNDLYFSISDVDTVRLGIKKDVHIDSDWTLFDKFTLTYYGENYTPVINIIEIGSPATELTDGQTYVAYNKGRGGFLNENTSNKQLLLKKTSTLTLPQSANFAVKAIKSGDQYKFQIVSTGDYMQALVHGGNTFAGAAETAENFTPTYNTSASCWYIKGSGDDYWNGNPTTFVGWNATGGNSAYILKPCKVGSYDEMLKDELAAVSSVLAHKGQVGYPVDAAFNAYQAAYDDALAKYANGTCSDIAGFLGYTELVKALAAFKAADRNMPQVGTFYQIQNFWDNRGAICYDSTLYPYVQSTGHSKATVSATNDFNFGIFENNGKYYLYNAAKKQFLAPVAAPTGKGHYTSQDPDGKAGQVWEFTDTPTPFVFSTEGMEIPNIWIKTAPEADSRTLAISNSYTEPVITYYAAGDGGVPMTFTNMGTATEDIVTAISRYFQPAGRYYQIASAYGRGNLYYEPTNAFNFVESSEKTGATVSAADNFCFGIVDYLGATYVFNKANGKFIAPVVGTLDATNSSDEQFGEYWQFVDAPAQVSVNYYKNATYKISATLKGLTKVLSIDNRYFEPVITYYAQNDEGFPVILTDAGEIDAATLAGIESMIYDHMVTGINSTTAKTITGRDYFSTNGAKLPKAAKGVNIVRIHFSDGTTKTQKVVVK